MKKKYLTLFFLLGMLAFCMTFCTTDSSTQEESSLFLNTHDSIASVGMQMCRSCHADIYDSYIQTGMGQSFGAANLEKTAAHFAKDQAVYDAINDLHYYPFFKDSIMYVLEYRLDGKDTTHSRLENINYIIGSGHHTNSHLINRNGYVYQAPITYYTQDKKWDLAPGFEENNQRFERAIFSECLTCHNHYPTLASGAENKYRKMPLGIECERCHGAGGLHVKEKLMGKIVDTSQFADYTIVNPKRLSIDRQMDLCQRCHLQGVAVLKEGKDFYDFKPSMHLEKVMNVFLPRFTDSDKRFIMASQADRLKLSNCFLVSEQLSCITCHNPHHDVHSTDKNNYNISCINCHNPKTTQSKLFACSESKINRDTLDNNCVQCHMPRSGSIDIPHVNITDHFISRTNTLKDKNKKLPKDSLEKIANFLGLKSLLVKNPSSLDMARGYLALYDKFMGSPNILDSVWFYLEQSTASPKEKQISLIHYYFNNNDYNQIITLANPANEITDAWTAYRIGEAAHKSQKLPLAKEYYQQATTLQPYNLQFQEKLGTTLAQLKELAAAKKVFEFILKEDKGRKIALSNLGLIYVQQGKITQALQYYDNALALDPDYKNALLNKISLLIYLKREKEAMPIIQHLIQKYPEQAKILKNAGINY